MKKLVFFILIAIVVVTVLVTSAFLYFYLHKHKTYLYDVYNNDKLWGFSKVDRYNTEDKIIYKSEVSLPYTSGFPQRNEKYFLKKTTLELLKFSVEFSGVFGQKEIILIEKEGASANYLFLKHPEFMKIKDPKINTANVVFSPGSLLSHMAVLEKYNFWKKGVQYVDVVMPFDGPVPPLKTRIEVRHLGDQYVSIMGRKIESEILSLNSNNFPETKVFVSKYSHKILMCKMHERRMKWILKNAEEGSGKVLKSIRKKVRAVLNKWYLQFFKKRKNIEESEIFDMSKVESKVSENVRGEREEVFFESSNLVLSGWLYKPKGEGPFTSVLMVPQDGLLMKGELEMFDSLCVYLSKAGYVCLFFQRPGQGKSQGVFTELDDERQVDNIVSAYEYFSTLPFIDSSYAVFLGNKGGGYLVLKAAEKISVPVGCVLINPEILLTEGEFAKKTVKAIMDKENIITLSLEELEIKETQFIENVNSVLGSENNVAYFLGHRLPYKEYKEFLSRDVFGEIEMFKNKMLIVAGKDDPYFSQMNLDKLQSSTKMSEGKLSVSVFRILGEFIGGTEYKENNWIFDFKRDPFEGIKNWIADENPANIEGETVKDLNDKKKVVEVLILDQVESAEIL